jgi:NAD-dependent dihydropyrimidine dehydrogenase PreA subunit
MAVRKIIKIDESRCTGCGECITSCAEGAIELKEGKARVVSDRFCDGLGACLVACPEGALTIEERESELFDEKAAKMHQKSAEFHREDEKVTPCTTSVCLSPDRSASAVATDMKKDELMHNQLSGWPIQMRLVRPWAPYLKGASLLIAGDCTAFAYPEIQKNFIKGRIVLVGCPKLDDTDPFVDKLAEILKANEIKDITVLHMTVPCCSQLVGLVAEAIKRSGITVPQKDFVVGIDGVLNPS